MFDHQVVTGIMVALLFVFVAKLAHQNVELLQHDIELAQRVQQLEHQINKGETK